MRAYREADANRGINVISSDDFAALTPVQRSSDVIYIVGTVAANTTTGHSEVTIAAVWIGNQQQSFLTNNAGALVWTTNEIDTATSGWTNAAVDISTLV